MLIRRLIPLLTSATIACCAQSTTPARPAFEVASVRPTEHGRNAEGLSISSDLGATSPGMFSGTNNSLDELIRWAFHVREYQISGPGWLNDDSECFDIKAKMAAGTPDDQLRLMVQALLEDRFKLALHRETRELPVYELLVAKAGVKPGAADPNAKPSISYQGKFWATMSSKNTSTTELANFLAGRLGRPVIDKTGIPTRFAFSMEYRFPDDNNTTYPTIFTAVEEKLGLRLQPAKGPVEILVIDHIDRTPSEN